MISVIVPVYNVELYLRKCIDSILAQTYRDLEILIIDDGSTDGSGAICDEYKKDERVRVFHTDNHGLSAARNLGLDNATGDWIGFVDSDDWIEPDLFEKSISCIGDADILCFSGEGKYTGFQAVVALVCGGISSSAWGKLYRRNCFFSTRFPEGRVHEDTATTYKILYKSEEILCQNIGGYHYCKRAGSITSVRDMDNLIGFWIACKDRLDYCLPLISMIPVEQRDQFILKLNQSVAQAIGRAWAYRNTNNPSDSPEWKRMNSIAKTMFMSSKRKSFPLYIQVGLFFAMYNTPFSFWAANRIYRFAKMFLLKDDV